MNNSSKMSDFYEDACYLSTSEAEPDSEVEEFDDEVNRIDTNQRNEHAGTTNGTFSPPSCSEQFQWDDPQALLNTWLGELDSLKVGLENGNCSSSSAGPRPLSVPDVDKLQIHEPRIDSYRFSMANLEDSQDGELDAILKELCALGSQFDQELKDDTTNVKTVANVDSSVSAQGGATEGSRGTNVIGGLCHPKRPPPTVTHISTAPDPTKMRLEMGNLGQLTAMNSLTTNSDGNPVDGVNRTDSGLRTDSPDNDSAFSDNISMLSSESSASSGASAARTDGSKSSGASSTTSNASSSLTVEADAAARLKAEKIRLALEKMREANVKKLFIKAFTTDGSTKSLLVDEKMTVGHVTRLLADKNHVRMEPKWVLVEHLTDLHMERNYEDHEMLVDQLMLWTRDSRNTLLFVERPEKYALFSRPEEFLLVGSSSEKDRNLDDDARVSLLDEFFSGTGIGVPEIEGPLYLKAEGKKAWKKFYFVLRASGLYYLPKGKSKSSKDLVCLATFEVNQVYTSVNWRKKYKAPTDFGFAIKHPKLQSKSSKFIKYLCAEDERTLAQWVMGIRIAKYGKTLMDNYRSLIEDLAQEDLDQLANARSFSLVSMAAAPTAPSTTAITELTNDETSSNDTPVNTLERVSHSNKDCVRGSSLVRQDSLKSRTSTSSSSGCLSERSSNGTSTPTFEHAFDSDFPMGTIKRKPSMTPKLPLTSTTRLLVKEVEDAVDGEVTDCGTLSRNSHRQSFRKSLTEEVNTIRRKTMVTPSNPDSSSRLILESDPELQLDKLSPTLEHDDLDALPLPPPPSFNSPVDDFSMASDSLPPPPPEAFEAMDSPSPLPLPPAELLNTTSFPPQSPVLKSKPPSPRPSPPVALKPCLKPTGTLGPKVPPKPVGCFPQRKDNTFATDDQNIYCNSVSPGSVPPQAPPKSPTKKNRRITFDDRLVHSTSPSPPPPPGDLSNSKPPAIPRRNEPLRSSLKQAIPKPIPQKLNSPGCTVTPPREFLKDLQRVMQKKWQVAQKCKDDVEVTPHEVLGFRDQPPPSAPVPAAYKENSVRAWVAEHYGSGADLVNSSDSGLGFYENVFVPNPNLSAAVSPINSDVYQNCVELRREYPHPYLPAHQAHTLSSRMSSVSVSSNGFGDDRSSRTLPSSGMSDRGSKRLPPPPPKRSDTTHLSTRIH